MASSSHALSVAQHEAAEAMRALQRAHDRVERHSRLMMPPRATRPSSEPLYANEEGLTLKAVGQHLSSVAEGEEDGRTPSHPAAAVDERITWYKAHASGRTAGGCCTQTRHMRSASCSRLPPTSASSSAAHVPTSAVTPACSCTPQSHDHCRITTSPSLARALT